MKIKISITLIIILFAVIACQNEKYQQTKNGMKYRIYTDMAGNNAKTGDIVIAHLIHATENDSVILNTWKNRTTIELLIEQPNGSQDLMEGLMMLSEGDSAVFLLSSDSLIQYSSEIIDTSIYRKGSYVKYAVKILKIKSALSQ